MTAWKRHWRIPALLAAVVVALLLLGGDYRIIAYVGRGGDTSGYAPVVDYENDVALFDASVIHTVELDVDAADLDAMVRLYAEDGTKQWFPADIAVDGVTIEDVGIRLKGFSTLRTALGGIAGFRGEPPEVSYDDLPFLVRLDEFNPGISYQGITEFALRTEGPTEDETLLEEMASVAVLEAIGLEVPRVAYTSFAIAGGDATLRIIAEHPDDHLVERIEGDTNGVLYKAQSSGTFRYLGHDPTAYEGIFEQESAVGILDLAPLMDFMEFVETSSDEQFAGELDEWFDVDVFIDYLAAHNLLVNVDSLAGTNHNFYLLYDLDDRRLRVLSWDMNEALGGFWRSEEPSWALLPDWSNAQSTFGRPPVGEDGKPLPAGVPADRTEGLRPPEGFVPPGPPPEGVRPAPPDGGQAPAGEAGEELRPLDRPGAQIPGNPPDPNDGPPQGQPGILLGGENVLLSRFLEVEGFAASYRQRYGELAAEIFGGGMLIGAMEDAARLLDRAVDLGLITESEASRGLQERLSWIGRRAAFLEGLGIG